MPRFRTRPVEVQAFRISRPMIVETPEGTMKGEPGDWLITNVEGEQYFCMDSIFRKTYEPVDTDAVFELRRDVSFYMSPE